jgi:mediator of RNA polymerase II transcription subunit 18
LSKSSRKNRYVLCASHHLGAERPNIVKTDPNKEDPIPAHEDTPWQVIVKTANPVRGTQEIPLGRHIEAVLEVQALMKGLLDLRRQDA